MRDIRDIKAWEKAHALALRICGETLGFPSEERFGLTSQIRRAALSIPANNAEGCGRGTDSDFARFIQISLGSASEVEYLLPVVKDLKPMDDDIHGELHGQVVEVKRMLTSFLKKLKAES